MINIDTIYRTVKFIARQNGRGYMTPEEFNVNVNLVQCDLFTHKLGLPNDYRGGSPGAGLTHEGIQRLSNDLKPFKSAPTNIIIDNNGQAQYPSDYVYHDAFRKKVLLSNDITLPDSQRFRWAEVEVVDEAQLGGQLQSVIVAPEPNYPICVTYANYIQFYPENLNNATMTYLRYPPDAIWAYTMPDGRTPEYDPTKSIDLLWDKTLTNEITIGVLKYFGISVRDAELVAASQELKQEVN